MHKKLFWLLLYCILLLLVTGMYAQNAPVTKETPAKLKKAANNLEKSLIENNNPQIARDYEVLAQGFTDKDDLPEAETYLFKALEIYTTANNTAGRARVIRNIAHVQEMQGKLRSATRNYKIAEEAEADKVFKALNYNNYQRLKNRGNTNLETSYLNRNITLLKKIKRNSEIADSYTQLATLELTAGDTTAALAGYQKALPYANGYPDKSINIYNHMAGLYTGSKQYDNAIATINNMLQEASKIKDSDTRITGLRDMAGIYFKINDSIKAVDALNVSYKTASAAGKTFEAKESLALLTDYYKLAGNNDMAMQLYDDFYRNLDRIILSDTSLTDAKTFKVTEERIRRLENEKTLKDELLTRRNTFNYLLLASIVLLLLFFGFIIKALYSIKTKNKEIALQSLRREMNPHFLFNSLNSVNQFIAQNNELEANKYLTSYSNLMRNTMENSNKDFVTLGNETENLKKYLELEHLRFKDKFDYTITLDDKLDKETIWVPNMILQPHLENAIWHGLRYKEDKGLLKINFTLTGREITVTIDDDGIGPTRSGQLKTSNQKLHQSRGLTNTRERITLINQLYKTNISFTITEKEAPQTGTVVKVIIPIINHRQ